MNLCVVECPKKTMNLRGCVMYKCDSTSVQVCSFLLRLKWYDSGQDARSNSSSTERPERVLKEFELV